MGIGFRKANVQTVCATSIETDHHDEHRWLLLERAFRRWWQWFPRIQQSFFDELFVLHAVDIVGDDDLRAHELCTVFPGVAPLALLEAAVARQGAHRSKR